MIRFPICWRVCACDYGQAKRRYPGLRLKIEIARILKEEASRTTPQDDRGQSGATCAFIRYGPKGECNSHVERVKPSRRVYVGSKEIGSTWRFGREHPEYITES